MVRHQKYEIVRITINIDSAIINGNKARNDVVASYLVWGGSSGTYLTLTVITEMSL